MKALDEGWYESYWSSPSPRLEGERDIALALASRAPAQGPSSSANTKPNNHPPRVATRLGLYTKLLEPRKVPRSFISVFEYLAVPSRLAADSINRSP